MFIVRTDRFRAHVFVSNSKSWSTRFSLINISSRAGRPPDRGGTLFLFYFFLSRTVTRLRVVVTVVIAVDLCTVWLSSFSAAANQFVISVLCSGPATRPTITCASGLLAPRSVHSFRVHGRLPPAVRIVVVVAAIVLHRNRRLSARM